ncbi:MAG: carbohydrate ABC transporter permease [Eubacteriales bacterium]|nr:carbohydrate ABC transporter permease [Eubacteriales bacterium]
MKKVMSVLGRVLLGFLLFLTLVPFYLLLSNSFKWSQEIVKSPFTLPQEWHFTNYAKAAMQVIHPMLNTLIVTFFVIVIVLVVGTLAAYAFVRFRFAGSTFLYMAIMALLMIPGFVLLIPQFIHITRLNMYNTFAGLIFPPAAASSATAAFLLRTSMEGLSKSLFEAADMEGAGDLTILMKIVVPLSKPTLSTVTIMTGLSAWNNYLWPLVSTTGENTQQIAVALTGLVRSAVEGNGVMFAGYVTASIPLIILFSCASKSFVAGLTQGAVKG